MTESLLSDEKTDGVITIAGESADNGVDLSVKGETPESGVTLTSGKEQSEPGIATDITGESGEAGETVREPRENVKHYADHTFENDVTIAGTLRTKRWVHPHGAMFRTLSKLEEEIPNPEPGMWALVGTRWPMSIYICEKPGVWSLPQKSMDYDELKDWLQGELEDNGQFVRKDRPDRTPHPLSVGGLLRAEDALESLAYMAGMNGFGWGTDRLGNFSMESITVRSFMRIAELIVNRLSAIEGDQLLTEADTIEEVTYNGDGTYTLKLQEKWDGYFTAQYEHNVIKGIYNNITPGLKPGAGQQSMNGAVMYTSWMNVTAVDTAKNEITVILYPDSQTPAGHNFPPEPQMRIARWGNSGDSNDERFAMRQQCLYLSSTEGRVVKLFRVTKPIIDEGNIALCLGTVPEFLRNDLRIGDDDDVIYVKTLVAQNILRTDYKGRPKPTTVDRGDWKEGETYFDGTVLDTDGDCERSLTWRNGHGWLCSQGGVAIEGVNDPQWNTTAWTHALGDDRLLLEFEQADSLVDTELPYCPLSVRAYYRGTDITDSNAIYFNWDRQSERGGTQDTTSDTLWNDGHVNAGAALELRADDLNFQFGVPPEKLEFTVTAVLHDPNNPNLPQAKANFYLI